jgi:NADH-quinone oxidoreductase subunit L
MIYVSKNLIPESDENIIGVKRFIYNKLYIDELYNYTITQPINKISEVLEKYFDTLVVDGLVNATGKIVRLKGQVFAKLQTGNTGTYLLAMVFAIIVILVISLF